MTGQSKLLFAVVTGLSMSGAAIAQTPRPAAPGETPQLATPDAPKPPPEQVRPPDTTMNNGDANLTDRLSKQQGTLQPPAVDPGIHAPLPPRTSENMPVIRPPGTPGGDQK